MKKIILALVGALLMLSSCGVGNYSLSSGKPDDAYVSFVSAKSIEVSVSVDANNVYSVKTVKDKAWTTDRKIKETAKNTIILTPGQHSIVVTKDGQQIYSKKIFVSAQDHKVIEL